MKRMVFFAVTLAGCAPGAGSAETTSGPAASASASLPEAPQPAQASGRRAARVALATLPADAVRVPLLVIPADAPVEVDGVPVRRRNGAVELVGKVGEVRRVRAFRGSTPGEEKYVTIEAKGTSPALIDANEVKAAAPVKAKARPVRFNLNE